jgi:CheY-like chemotaxis protein
MPFSNTFVADRTEWRAKAYATWVRALSRLGVPSRVPHSFARPIPPSWGNTKGVTMQKNPPSVFIVDDEQIIAETLTMILQRNGFDAKFFTDPLEALIAAHKEAPDLILSDVMMPQLSGVDLAIAIQRECPECKIMLFSGHAGTLDLLSKAREKGYDFNLLPKPLHPVDLLRHIRQQHPDWALVPD